MYQDFKNHKRSDKVKWIISFTLIIVLLFGVAASLYLGIVNRREQEDILGEDAALEIGADDVNQTYKMPKLLTFTEPALRASAATAGTNTVSVNIEAEVYPANAPNKAVDYTVAWGVAPTHGSESVSNYLTCVQESNGSTLATVTCKKAFGTDKIVITVKTRDGGFTDTCTVSFAGIATAMSITTTELTAKSTSARGLYYELGTSRTYTFKVNLTNPFNSVAKDCKITVGGVGKAFFGKRYFNDAGYSTYLDYVEKDLSTVASRVITSATLVGDTLTIKTGSMPLTNLRGAYTLDSNSYEYYADSYVVEEKDDWSDIKDKNDTFYIPNAKTNAQRLDGYYFYVNVKDEVSGLEDRVRLWVVTGVSNVMLSDETLRF